MKKMAATSIFVLLLSTFANAAGAVECRPDFCPVTADKQTMMNRVLEKHKQQLWKNIAWRHDAATAMRDAQQQNKPIFVFLVVNDGLKPGSGKS
jgi:hypothetical protein